MVSAYHPGIAFKVFLSVNVFDNTPNNHDTLEAH